MEIEQDKCYRSLAARDRRFDGCFFVGVTSTGIYCRPVCTARTPKRSNCRFYRSAAEAEGEGFRPCLRCRPELAPGSAPVDKSSRIAALAFDRIEAGALSNGAGLNDLARDLCISQRHLRRVVQDEYGVSPVAIAQTQRLLLAKKLLTETSLPITEVAFSAGFESVRRFNHLFRNRYDMSPKDLRNRKCTGDSTTSIRIRLAYRPPLDWKRSLEFFAHRAIAGVESVDETKYARTVRTAEETGWFLVEMVDEKLYFECSISLLKHLPPLIDKVNKMFDLKAHPQLIMEHLQKDERLKSVIRKYPGARIPGCFCPFELALRAIIGQLVSVKSAGTIAARIARAYGQPIHTPFADLFLLSPDPGTLVEAGADELRKCGLTAGKANAIVELSRQVEDGELKMTASADNKVVLAKLAKISGIGPWTTSYIAMRALNDPDAFPFEDLGLRKAAAASSRKKLSLRELRNLADNWRPWRAYAAIYLWTLYGEEK